MDMNQFRAGQGVSFVSGGRRIHAIVMRAHDVGLELAQVVVVNRLDARHICYNEPGANYDLHRDNVKLRDCPPPFTELMSVAEHGSFVHADVKKLRRLSKQKCEAYGVIVLDDGITVTNDMMRELWNHPWHDDLHRELSRNPKRIYGDGNRRRGLDIDGVDMSDDCELNL